MIQKIKNEIEKYLLSICFVKNNTNNRNFITFDIEYILNNHVAKNDIYSYKVICNEENNISEKNYINIDVYIQENWMYKTMNINFIYAINDIAALQILRKQKLNKLNETR